MTSAAAGHQGATKMFQLHLRRAVTTSIFSLGRGPSPEADAEHTHVVELQFALVLFLQVSRQVVQDGSAAAPVGVEARGPSHLMHLQTRLFICGGDRNTR